MRELDYGNLVDILWTKATSLGIGTRGTAQRVVSFISPVTKTPIPVTVITRAPNRWSKGELFLDMRKGSSSFRKFVRCEVSYPTEFDILFLPNINEVVDPSLSPPTPEAGSTPSSDSFGVVYFLGSDPSEATVFSTSPSFTSPNFNLSSKEGVLYIGIPSNAVFSYASLTHTYIPTRLVNLSSDPQNLLSYDSTGSLFCSGPQWSSTSW